MRVVILFSIGILLASPNKAAAQIITYGGSGGGSSAPTSPNFNSINFNIANHDACIRYGPGRNSVGLSNTLRITCGTTTPQELDIYGTDTGVSSTSYFSVFTPPAGSGQSLLIKAESGDGLDAYVGVAIQSQSHGQISIGNGSAAIFVISPTADENGTAGTNIRSDDQYGFSSTAGGPGTDTVVAGFQYEGSALIKVTNGTTGYGTLDVLGLKASGTAGASCAITTLAHLTVVNGIVTVCN